MNKIKTHITKRKTYIANNISLARNSSSIIDKDNNNLHIL